MQQEHKPKTETKQDQPEELVKTDKGSKRSLLTLENYFIKQILRFLKPQYIVRLALTCKEMRNRLRTVMLKELKLDYSDSKWRINKNFFHILKNNYFKKVIKLTQEEFASLMGEPKAKDLHPVAKAFFPGTRIVKTKVGPKGVGVLAEGGRLTLIQVECFDKMNFDSGRVYNNVKNFEVNGWCIVEDNDGNLSYVEPGKDQPWHPQVEIPCIPSMKPSNIVSWSSSFDRLAVAYRQSSISEDHQIALYTHSSMSEPILLEFTGIIKQLCLGKLKLYVVDTMGDLHSWDLSSELYSHSTQKGNAFSRVYSNHLLSFLFCKDNRGVKLDTMTAEQVCEWLTFLGLHKFRDTVQYAKIDGKRLSTFTPENMEQLFGLPYDSPEVNHLVLHNKLLDGEYFRPPVLSATGYNGNNELGISTGTNMIQDLQDFSIKIDDFHDDVHEVKIGGFATFLTTLKNRKFTCYDPPEEKGVPRKDSETAKDSSHSHDGSDSDEEETTGGKGKKNKGNKGGNKKKAKKEKFSDKDHKAGNEKRNAEKKAAGEKIGKNQPAAASNAAGNRGAKKFEKNKWKEITDLFENSPELRDYHVDWIECTKHNVFLICHDKPKLVNEELAKERLMTTGAAVLRLLKDPKLNCYKYMAGIKNNKFDIDEMPLEKYLQSDIPEHWVMYLRHSDSMKIVWDRRDYTELLDDLDIIL